MAKVIVFGIQDFAELAHYYLTNDSVHEVVAFSVNAQYLPEERSFKGLPVLAFEDIVLHFPPSEYHFFAPMAPVRMNRLREEIYHAIKAKGYEMISYVSSKATLFDNPIGDNVILWSGNHIGHHSIIKDHIMFTSHVVMSGHCTIENYAILGVNATIRDGLTIAEGTFVAMAASVIKNTEPWGLYKGNPAVKSEKPTTEL